LGMTLDESIDGLKKFESDGIDFYLEPKLVEFLTEQGKINIDFVSHQGRQGYRITVGNGDGCSSGSCGGCSSS